MFSLEYAESEVAIEIRDIKQKKWIYGFGAQKRGLCSALHGFMGVNKRDI